MHILLQPNQKSFTVAKVVDFDTQPSDLLFEATVMIYHERVTSISAPYWSDVGGFAFVLYIAVGIMMFPLSEHLFYLQAIEELFLARTKDKSSLFPKSKKFQAQRKEDQREF